MLMMTRLKRTPWSGASRVQERPEFRHHFVKVQRRNVWTSIKSETTTWRRFHVLPPPNNSFLKRLLTSWILSSGRTTDHCGRLTSSHLKQEVTNCVADQQRKVDSNIPPWFHKKRSIIITNKTFINVTCSIQFNPSPHSLGLSHDIIDDIRESIKAGSVWLPPL